MKELTRLTTEFSNIYTELNNKVAPNIEKVENYLNGNMTKLDLATIYNNPFFVEVLEDLAEMTSNLDVFTKEYTGFMALGSSRLTVAYSDLIGLTLPVIDHYNVYQLNLISKASAINDSEISQLVATLNTSLSGIMIIILQRS